jgi:hypothetical protein
MRGLGLGRCWKMLYQTNEYESSPAKGEIAICARRIVIRCLLLSLSIETTDPKHSHRLVFGRATRAQPIL